MSDSTGRSIDDLDPERFIARAEQRWRAAVGQARLEFDRARTGPPAEVARAAVRLARLLKGPGLLAEAEEVLGEGINICAGRVSPTDDVALEAFADLVRESGRRPEAMRLYELSAIAGRTDAAQQSVELMLQSELVVGAILRRLPPREQQVLALTASTADHEYVARVLNLSQVEVGEYEQRGLALLEPHLRADRPDKLIIDGKVHFAGFDADFPDSTTMPGEVIGGTLTNEEKAMIQLMDPKDRARYLLQKRIQEKAEMAVLLSQLQSLRHQTALSVINNIR